MLEVKFYHNVEDEKLEFAVIISKYQGKWVFCKHKERITYEVPGGAEKKMNWVCFVKIYSRQPRESSRKKLAL